MRNSHKIVLIVLGVALVATLFFVLHQYLDQFIELIEHYMLIYGYWAVFFGVMLENAGLPVPGETILLVAGYFSSTGEFSITLVMLIAAVGAVIGDNIGFAIGHHYGRGFILKVGRFVFLTPKRFEYMENYFKSHGNKTIFVARFITGLRVFAALLAGASNMRWRTFLFYNVTGAILWSIVITSLGYIFGQSLPILIQWVGRSGTILLIAGVIGAFIAWRIYKFRQTDEL
ncbi:MAG: DedA family protein [Acidobacteriota bacterium]